MGSLRNEPERQAILKRIDGLAADAQPNWGLMSAPQMVCHLIDQQRLTLGEFDADDRSNVFSRTLVKWLALYVVTWPKGKISAPAGLDSTKPSEFKADVERLKELAAAVAVLPADGPKRLHFVFGRLTPTEWGRLSYLHIDHHLRQFGA